MLCNFQACQNSLSHGCEEASSLFTPCAEFPNPGITLGVYFQTSLNLHFTNPFWIHHKPLNKSEKQQLLLATAALSCRWQLHRLQWNFLRFDQRLKATALGNQAAYEQLNPSSFPAGAQCSSAFGEIWRDLA